MSWGDVLSGLVEIDGFPGLVIHCVVAFLVLAIWAMLPWIRLLHDAGSRHRARAQSHANKRDAPITF